MLNRSLCYPLTKAIPLQFFKQASFLAQRNVVTQLPVLDAMVNKFAATDQHPLKETAVIYVHHSLRTSLNLLDAMFALGLLPKHTFVLGKHYSENTWVVEETKRRGVYYQPCSTQKTLGSFDQHFTLDINNLWAATIRRLQENSNIKNILILDHGGYAINLMPAGLTRSFSVVGLEKTSSGLVHWARHGTTPTFPLINMANCAAKKFLESPLIAKAVVDKLSAVIPVAEKPTICGVIGYGAIGKAIVEKLLSFGHKVIVYDNDPAQLQTTNLCKNFFVTDDLVSLIATADLLFGCSGQDITRAIEIFRLSTRDKILVSCSSGDREFLTLLQLIQKQDQTGKKVDTSHDVTYESSLGSKIKILRGGFPYNFDHSGESVPANDIQLTRALVLAGVLQAIDFFNKSHVLRNGGLYTLDAYLQKFVVDEWLQYQPGDRYTEKVLSDFQDIEWIRKNSPGIQEEALNFTLDHSGKHLRCS